MKSRLSHSNLPFRALSGSLVVWALSCGLLMVHGNTIVLPRAAETEPGFGAWGWNKGYSVRIQQVINPEELSSVMPNGAFINKLSFRSDEAGLPYTITFDSVEVRLSTSSARADGLSEVFAQNVGRDETVVYATGPVRWAFTSVQSGPNSFDAVIPFMTPFLYDPRRGALLIDMTFVKPNSTNPFGPIIDAHLKPADGFSAVFASLAQNPDLNAGFAQNFGYVMQLDFTAIPEPSALALGVLGGCLLLPHCAYTRARGALAI